MAVKTLTIDGQLVSASEDQTVLEAAHEAGIFIPALCRLEGVTPVGACRVCLVEIGASNRLAGLEPAYAVIGAETRLTAGPMASESAVRALCVELSSLAGACRVAAPIRAY